MLPLHDLDFEEPHFPNYRIPHGLFHDDPETECIVREIGIHAKWHYALRKYTFRKHLKRDAFITTITPRSFPDLKVRTKLWGILGDGKPLPRIENNAVAKYSGSIDKFIPRGGRKLSQREMKLVFRAARARPHALR